MGLSAFLVVFLIGDTILRHAILDAVTAIRTTDIAPGSVPVSPGARLQTDILAMDSYDGRWWVMHTLEMLRGNGLRIRHTALDNAPQGRELHWSSSIIWLLGMTASLLGALQAKASAACITQAAFWVGPLHLLLCLLLLGGLVARRFGLALALIFTAIFSLSPLVYQCFRAGLVDHHGLVCVFAVASVFCLIAGGGGLVRPPGKKADRSRFPILGIEQARPWFTASGVLGGAALWVSAASFIPVLAGCGGGALAALVLRDRMATRAAPTLWRTWGRAGCLSSLGFYALEYFPMHLGYRLEVNHPFFALAWLGAADLLARLGDALTGQSPFPRGVKSWVTAAAALLAVALPPTLIVLYPQKFFWVSDKFLLLLHNQFIQEFQSLPRLLAQSPPLDVLSEIFTWPLFALAGMAWLITRRLIPKCWHALLALALAPTLIMQALGIWQIRWLILSAGLWAVCTLLVLAAYADRQGARSMVLRVSFALALLLTFAGKPLLSGFALLHLQTVVRTPPKSAIPSILARDVAHRLVQSSPQRLSVVLCGPTTATDLNYFAGLKTIGTLYWENIEGLKRAAHMFAAPDEARARELIEQAGVTHILVSTWDNFGIAYVELLRQAGHDVPVAGRTFIETLLRDQQPPDWLRPLYYPIPAGFDIQEELRLYAVIPGQLPAEARLHRGIYAFDAQDFAGAEKLFSEALALDPSRPEIPAYLAEARRRQAATPSPATPYVKPAQP